MEKVICKNCNKEFAYEFWGTVYPRGKDKEDVECLYCGEKAFSRITSQCISVYKVDSQG